MSCPAKYATLNDNYSFMEVNYMNSPIDEYYVDNADSLIEVYKTVTKEDPFLGLKDVFLRGVPDSSFKLVPSIDRPGNERILQYEDEAIREALKQFPETILGTDKSAIADTITEYCNRHNIKKSNDLNQVGERAEIEEEILRNHALRFSTNIIGRGDIALGDIAILQHYGFPTRLLDITTDLKVAVFFACQDCYDNSVKNGLIYVFESSLTCSLKQIDSTQPYHEFINEQSPFAFRLKRPFFRDECQCGDFIFVPDKHPATSMGKHTLVPLNESDLVIAKIIVDASAKRSILKEFSANPCSSGNYKTIYADGVEGCFRAVAQAFRAGEKLW